MGTNSLPKNSRSTPNSKSTTCSPTLIYIDLDQTHAEPSVINPPTILSGFQLYSQISIPTSVLAQESTLKENSPQSLLITTVTPEQHSQNASKFLITSTLKPDPYPQNTLPISTLKQEDYSQTNIHSRPISPKHFFSNHAKVHIKNYVFKKSQYPLRHTSNIFKSHHPSCH